MSTVRSESPAPTQPDDPAVRAALPHFVPRLTDVLDWGALPILDDAVGHRAGREGVRSAQPLRSPSVRSTSSRSPSLGLPSAAQAPAPGPGPGPGDPSASSSIQPTVPPPWANDAGSARAEPSGEGSVQSAELHDGGWGSIPDLADAPLGQMTPEREMADYQKPTTEAHGAHLTMEAGFLQATLSPAPQATLGIPLAGVQVGVQSGVEQPGLPDELAHPGGWSAGLEPRPAPASERSTEPADEFAAEASSGLAALLASPPELQGGDMESVRQRVLAGVQRQVDSLLEYRLREAMAPHLAAVAETLVQSLRQELAATLQDVVMRAVAQEVSRTRPRQPDRLPGVPIDPTRRD
jgi:hypothetical protein